MLRRLQNFTSKNVDGQLKVSADIKRGTLVQKNLVSKTIVLPTNQEGLFFLDADKQATGLMTYEGEVSEYDVRLDVVKANELGQLEKPVSGERYATSEYVATDLVVGGYVKAETTVGDNQGKVVHSAVATGFKFGGFYNDNGNTLAIVEVI